MKHVVNVIAVRSRRLKERTAEFSGQSQPFLLGDLYKQNREKICNGTGGNNYNDPQGKGPPGQGENTSKCSALRGAWSVGGGRATRILRFLLPSN